MNDLKKDLGKKMIGFTTMTNAIHRLGSRISRRRVFRAALVRAYAISGHSSFFLDKEFQARGANRLQACYLENGPCPTPAELGKFWADQVLFAWLSDSTKRRCFAELTEVAVGFLRRLEAELCAERDLRAVLVCSD